MPAPTNDETLVREVRAGSSTAFGELMARYERLVYRVSFAYTRDREDALDVTQNVFLKVHRGLDSYRGAGAFKAWLMRIVHHENMNWIRDEGKQPRRTEEAKVDAVDKSAIDPAAVVSPNPSPDAGLLRASRRRFLGRALLCLNHKQRQAVELRYFGELSIREIAEVLSCSEGVVKNILFRSLRKLRHELAAEER